MLPTFGPRRQGLLSYRPIQSGRTGRAPCLSHVFQHFLPHSTGQTRRSKNHQANQMVFRSFRCARYCGGTGAGAYGTDTGREAIGSFAGAAGLFDDVSGVFSLWPEQLATAAHGSGLRARTADFALSRVWGEHTGNEFAPAHYTQPLGLYLGNPAHV